MIEPKDMIDWFDWAPYVAHLLDQHDGGGREAQGLRILKIAEEAGEAAAAWIGYVGQNPRKGVTHTQDDVVKELADVAATALVAIASLGADPRRVLADHLACQKGDRLHAYQQAARKATSS